MFKYCKECILDIFCCCINSESNEQKENLHPKKNIYNQHNHYNSYDTGTVRL